MKTNKKLLLSSIAILVGTSIGAGILGLPYTGSKAGFYILIFYILFLGIIASLVNLYLGEITLRTKEKHQLPGYTKKYIGEKSKKLLELAMVFGVYSAIIAYLFGVGESFSFLIFNNFKYSLLIGLAFGIFMSYLLWNGLNDLKKFEKIGTLLIVGLLVIISTLLVKKIEFSNLITYNLKYIFLPLGVVLFSLSSFNAIPELRLVLDKKEKLMKKSILIGMAITIFVYIFFSFMIIGNLGAKTPQVATISLGGVFILFGILTMFTSYLSLGNSLLENFSYDLKFKKKKAWFRSEEHTSELQSH